MTSTSSFKSSLDKIHNIVQNTMNLHTKELIIFSLRDFFTKDTTYRYVTDHYGFPKIVDITDFPLDAGIVDDSTTRLCIQEAFREEPDFFPTIIVRSGSFTSVPISFNRETGSIKYGNMIFQDGYGNIKTFKYPEYFIFAGAWEGSINIDIYARDMRTKDDLVDLVAIRFVDIAYNELLKEGLVVMGTSTAGTSDVDDRNNKIFKDTITLKIRSEWRRHIPVSNVIEVMNVAIEFGLDEEHISPNLTINSEISLLENLSNL